MENNSAHSFTEGSDSNPFKQVTAYTDQSPTIATNSTSRPDTSKPLKDFDHRVTLLVNRIWTRAYMEKKEEHEALIKELAELYHQSKIYGK